MVRSFAFTTKGRLHSKDIELFLMPTLLADTKLFLWVDLENPTPQETEFLLKNVFHFHPLSIEDSVAESPSPKVEEYLPKENDAFSPYLFMVIHAVDYSRKDGVFATSELSFYLGKNFLVTFHSKPLRPVEVVAEMCLRNTVDIAREPDRVAQELALIAVRLDVTEELDRLRAHVAAARTLIAEGSPAGRKLDFLAQEFMREANTLCSKAQNAGLTAIGLDLKAVIDQMREQVRNVE